MRPIRCKSNQTKKRLAEYLKKSFSLRWALKSNQQSCNSCFFAITIVGCGSLHARHIGFDLAYDTAAPLFWRVLPFLFLSFFFNNTLSDGKHNNNNNIAIYVQDREISPAITIYLECQNASETLRKTLTGILYFVLPALWQYGRNPFFHSMLTDTRFSCALLFQTLCVSYFDFVWVCCFFVAFASLEHHCLPVCRY